MAAKVLGGLIGILETQTELEGTSNKRVAPKVMYECFGQQLKAWDFPLIRKPPHLKCRRQKVSKNITKNPNAGKEQNPQVRLLASECLKYHQNP